MYVCVCVCKSVYVCVCVCVCLCMCVSVCYGSCCYCRSVFTDVMDYIHPIDELILSKDNVQVEWMISL